MNYPKYVLMEEAAGDTASGGGSGSADVELNIDIAKASDSLAADLGLGDSSSARSPSQDDKDKNLGQGPSAEEKVKQEKAAKELDGAKKILTDKKIDFTGKKDEEVLALAKQHSVRQPPKSWKKEMHEHFTKLDPSIQDYIDEREKQALEGLMQYKETAEYGKNLKEVISPYLPLFEAQGVKDPSQAVKYLLNAHYQLSVANPEVRTAMFAKLAKQYKIDLDTMKVLMTNEDPYVDPATKALKERLDKFEGQRTEEQRAQYKALQDKTAAEVKAFSEDPAHPYFAEVANDIVLLLQDPKMSLKDAYERAIWANPVTRAKEQARLDSVKEEELRKKTAEEAEKARRAKGTDIKGAPSTRSNDPLGSMDETLRGTYREIQSRH